MLTPHCPEGWTAPTPAAVCALLKGRTQVATAAALRVSTRQVRAWMKGETRMAWATWYTLSQWVREGEP